MAGRSGGPAGPQGRRAGLSQGPTVGVPQVGRLPSALRPGQAPVPQGRNPDKPGEADLGSQPGAGREFAVFGPAAVGLDPAVGSRLAHGGVLIGGSPRMAAGRGQWQEQGGSGAWRPAQGTGAWAGFE